MSVCVYVCVCVSVCVCVGVCVCVCVYGISLVHDERSRISCGMPYSYRLPQIQML